MTRQGNGACGWRAPRVRRRGDAASETHRVHRGSARGAAVRRGRARAARARRRDPNRRVHAPRLWTKSFDVSRLGNVVAHRTKVADKHAYNKELRSPKFWRALNVTYALLFEADVTFDSKPSDPLASFVDALERGGYTMLGAPWRETRPFCPAPGHCVGNSGLSLWHVPRLLELLALDAALPPEQRGRRHNVDVFVAKALRRFEKPVPENALAGRFAEGDLPSPTGVRP